MNRNVTAFLVPALLLLGGSGCLPGSLSSRRPGRDNGVDRTARPGEGHGEVRALAGPSAVPAYPAFARDASRALASEAGAHDTPQEVALPPLERWPRTFPDGGPFYALAQFSPYVGQFGILKDSRRADDGYGFAALFGYRLPLTNALAIGVEVQYEISEHVNASADVKAHQTRAGVAMRATFNFDQRLRPFGVAGGGQYDMEFNSVPPDFFLSGQGFFVGGGIDYVHMEQLTIRGELTYHFWDAAEVGSGRGGVGQTLYLGVGAAYSF